MDKQIKFNNFRSKLICRNCGKPNHHIKDCYEPKTSFGIILYKFINRKLKILLIKRRNTLGFVQFVRGQYNIHKIDYLQKLFNVMTNEEIELIKNRSFRFLWNYLWKTRMDIEIVPSHDYVISLKKYNTVTEGINIDVRNYNLDTFIKNRTSNYIDQEWGFPKGRKNKKETNIETAIREFTEETGISEKSIKTINKKFIENYISYDDVEYKNVYFLAKYNGSETEFNVSDDMREQFAEVSAIKFFGIEEAHNIIRGYSCKKKLIVKLVEKYINSYL